MLKTQSLLKIELPRGKELRGADFREMLAKENNLPEAFFHYKDGKPKNGDPLDKLQLSALPPICIVSGRGWVGVLAQPGHEELLDSASGKIIRAVTKRVGELCKIEMQNPTFGCAEQKQPETYWIRELVLKRRNPTARAAEIEQLVEQRVKAGMERYATAYGLDLPSWTAMDLRITQCERPRGLAIRTTSGTTNEYATLVDVEFKAFIDLKGIWMLGNLTSRGYGRVGHFRNAAPSTLAVIK